MICSIDVLEMSCCFKAFQCLLQYQRHKEELQIDMKSWGLNFLLKEKKQKGWIKRRVLESAKFMPQEAKSSAAAATSFVTDC